MKNILPAVFTIWSIWHFLKDHATANFLNWFVSEQVEEEAAAKAVIDMIKLTGSAPGGMFMVDRELAARPAATDPLNPVPAA
ncbi:MAG: ferritin-like domain-containing protein [Candidatus Riflebacteria bacterium]|nr:ferritin-like domain-containing protein [Candidatus Riflebacteria bacterium]